MSWLNFSSTSLSNVLFGWLDASLPAGPCWELARRFEGDDVSASRRRFLVEPGVAGMLARVVVAAPPNTRFCGRTEAAIVRSGITAANIAAA